MDAILLQTFILFFRHFFRFAPRRRRLRSRPSRRCSYVLGSRRTSLAFHQIKKKTEQAVWERGCVCAADRVRARECSRVPERVCVALRQRERVKLWERVLAFAWERKSESESENWTGQPTPTSSRLSRNFRTWSTKNTRRELYLSVSLSLFHTGHVVFFLPMLLSMFCLCACVRERESVFHLFSSTIVGNSLSSLFWKFRQNFFFVVVDDVDVVIDSCFN